MANIKISDLTAASAAADANEFEINEAGTSKKVTGSQIKAYVNAGDGALAAKNTVATADIDNLAVTTGKLAADAVDGTKIADDAIGNEHIATDAVNADSIAANSVGADELNVTGNGTAGQLLASDGDGTMTWTTVSGGGDYILRSYTGSSTWTKPANLKAAKVSVVGGGGGGSTNNPGGTGGTSSFGGYCSATGGNSAPWQSNVPGAGSGGQINYRGIPAYTSPNNNILNAGYTPGFSGLGTYNNNNATRRYAGSGYGYGAVTTTASGSLGSGGGAAIEYFDAAQLAANVSVTVGGAGSNGPGGATYNAGAGVVIVEEFY